MRQLLKWSNIPGKEPQTDDLLYGQLAVNSADGDLYMRKEVTATPTDEAVAGGSDEIVRIYRGPKVHIAVDLAERDQMVDDGIIGPMQMCKYDYNGETILELYCGRNMGWKILERTL